MRKYISFGAWVLKQSSRDDYSGSAARLIAGLHDPAIPDMGRDELFDHLKANYQLSEEIVEHVNFDMFWDGWVGEAGWHAQNGIVYLLMVGIAYKIGVTQQNVAHRIAALQTANPEPITLVSHFVVNGIGDSVLRWEKYLHQRFARYRKSGEWFALTDSDVAHFIFISQHYDYLQNMLYWDLTNDQVDEVIREVTNTRAYSRRLLGTRVRVPKGTGVLSDKWDHLQHGIVGRVTGFSDDPFLPSVCVRNKGKDFWVSTQDVVPVEQ